MGGLTLLPMLLLVLYSSLPKYTAQQTIKNEPTKLQKNNTIKRGWIQLIKMHKKDISELDMKRKKHVYAQLKCGALFIYESDQEYDDCKSIIPVHNYQISIYSPSEHVTFGRSTFLHLTSSETDEEYYITCERAVDKEDWYFGLIAAATVNDLEPVEMMDSTQFDPVDMQLLISTIQQDADYRQVQWLNAIVGRFFLSMYKTKLIHEYVQDKVSKKIKKANLPGLLGEVHIQSVDIGHSIPFITQPKLLSLTPEGDLLAEAFVDYSGLFRVVIQTDCSYSLIRVPLILSVMLKQLHGKFLFKMKPPPSNRYWIGFYELPNMKWEITPVISDKQIKLNMITNAIEAKIREFILENMVLPNMDDFPFYPSHGKGGIFGQRVPRPTQSEGKKKQQRGSDVLLVDMLGNKLFQETEPPKVDQRLVHDDILLLPKPPTRRSESVDILDSLDSKNSHRTNSTPEIRRMRNNSSPGIRQKVALEEEERMILPQKHNSISSKSTSSSTSSHSVNSCDIKFQSDEILADGSSLTETIHPLECDSINEQKRQDYADQDSVDSDSIRSSKSKFKYNKTKLINNMNNKKQVFYNMAGNLFNKKSSFIKPKVTKEMKEERNRELQEIHNRKMMGLFLTSPTNSEEALF
ncbi:hypothetical protein G6F23_006145 [Rhizopus arrhizus]|nr:hypothetical protein G6F23_006145 [Rhizopus arrhizus]